MRLLTCIALLIPLSVLAHEPPVRVSEVVSVYDADTFRVSIHGWPAIVGESMPIRVLGVDAPEIRGKCQIEKDAAQAAKAFTKQMLEAGSVIELHDIERGKYFRLLARVTIDGEDLAQQLISNGYARPYDGGTRLGWCNTSGEAGN
ncbi:thermonuclease family protein [Corallincola luteus]|uniref:Thermonuclease family protein n=1 Tax=Corallincola luteus TaxID=1775177 RepID=A0ABY2APB3_9GAMM|nr:thermonuclease family protein [Corallincola luteus]TCI05040.1 thermonuclease family protein [Corallincola luteus]